MDRKEIYKVIDGERAYQDEKWNPENHGRHEVEAYILYMEHHLQEARKAISTEDGTKGGLEQLRKVVGLGVACFEKHGVPERVPKRTMRDAAIEHLISSIMKGLLPNFTGTYLTLKEAEQIRQALNSRYPKHDPNIDEYYYRAILSRISR